MVSSEQVDANNIPLEQRARPTHKPPPTISPLAIAFALTLIFAVSGLAQDYPLFAKPADYVPVHTALEFISIAVSAMVFALGWNIRGQEINSHAVLLGVASFSVASIDLAHTLSYLGMPNLVTPSSPEKAINFWLAGRLVAAMALLLVSYTPLTHWSASRCNIAMIISGSLTALVWWLGLWHAEWLPRTFVTGQGLTYLKIVSEYLLTLLYAISALGLAWRTRRGNREDTAFLAVAAWTLALTELFFTRYQTVTDLSNLLGHVYKALAYLLIYRAIFVAGIMHPYRAVQQQNELLQSIIENAPIGVFWKDLDSRYSGCNSQFARDAGYANPDKLVGKTDDDLAWARHAEIYRADDRAVMESGRAKLAFEEPVVWPDGNAAWLRTSKVPLHGGDGQIFGLLGIYEDITTHKRALEELQQSEARMRAVFEGVSDGIVIVDAESGRVIDANPAVCRMLGYSRDELLQLRLGDIRHLSVAAVDDAKSHSSSGTESGVGREEPVRRKDGSTFPADVRMSYFEMNDRRCFAGIFIDLSERKRAEETVLKLSHAVEQSPESIIITDLDHRIEYVNEAFLRKTGYLREDVLGRKPKHVSFGKTPEETYTGLQQALAAGRGWSGEFHNSRKDGSEYVDFATISPLRSSSGQITHYVSVQEDITERKKMETELEFRASHDPLTGLANRTLLTDRLQCSIERARRSNRKVAAMMLDLDRFKYINDSLGHEVGDTVLQRVAEMLSKSIRAGDTVARLGGDEFMVVMPDIDAEQEAAELAVRVIETVGVPIQVGGYELTTTASLGIALFPRDGESESELIKNADVAMYRAKERGNNRFEFYSPDMNSRMLKRLELEAGLRQALALDQFELHYQPKVELPSGRAIGAEALIRWRHPILGMVPPNDFIPLAEETGLIIPIGEWLIGFACAQLRAWQQAGMPELKLAVNVSARQFRQENLPELVSQALQISGVEPRHLELEVTESAIMANPEKAAVSLQALKAIGVSISLDDFGTGYSSLSYLKRFPINSLKIDQSFVRDITTDPEDAAIAKLVIALGHDLGHRVIAEGVETPEQLQFLREHRCDEMQGYLFSRPLPPAEFAALMAENRRLTLD